MDVKKDLRDQLITQKILAVVTLVGWILILIYIVRTIIAGEIIVGDTFDWVIVAVGLFSIVFEAFRIRSLRNKIRELE